MTTAKRRCGALLAVLLASSFVGGGTASADSARFVEATGQRAGETTMTVRFHEVGLGAPDTISYVAWATATYTLRCASPGSLAQVTLRTTSATVAGFLTAAARGHVADEVSLAFSGGPSPCLSGEIARGIFSFRFSDVGLRDQTNGVTQAVAGEF